MWGAQPEAALGNNVEDIDHAPIAVMTYLQLLQAKGFHMAITARGLQEFSEQVAAVPVIQNFIMRLKTGFLFRLTMEGLEKEPLRWITDFLEALDSDYSEAVEAGSSELPIELLASTQPANMPDMFKANSHLVILFFLCDADLSSLLEEEFEFLKKISNTQSN